MGKVFPSDETFDDPDCVEIDDQEIIDQWDLEAAEMAKLEEGVDYIIVDIFEKN